MMKNRFIEINKEFKENGLNIPMDDNKQNIASIACGSSICSVGSIVGGALVGGAVGAVGFGIDKLSRRKNCLKHIDEISNNTSNIDTDVWIEILKENDISELLEKVKINKFSIHNYLNNLKLYFGLTKKELAQKSNFKEKYLDGVFNTSKKSKSRRNPSRDCILGLCFGFRLNIIEANYLLKAAGYNELYLRNKKDLIVAKCLYEVYSIRVTNEYLLKNGEEKIGTRDNDEMDVVI